MARKVLAAATAAIFSISYCIAKEQARTPALEDVAHHANASRNGMVVAGERMAAQIGASMLAEGGNAVDAAVATAFALAVTFPRAGNIGGGGFMLVHIAETNETIAIDYRETAPAGATRDMFLDENGEVDRDAITLTHKAAGVPGTVAGLLHAHGKYGKLSRRQVMAPAIRLAERGWRLSYYASAMRESYRERLTRYDATRKIFFKEDGEGYAPGEKVYRRDLARVLKAISRKGRDGFYKGWVADAIADDMTANNGLITRDDLAAYKPIERQPITGTFRDYNIIAMPPPSSGGVHIIQILNMLETQPPYHNGNDNAAYLHFLAEAMRLAFADRATHLGDPDFVDVPVIGLTSKVYAEELGQSIDPGKTRPSSEIGAGNPSAYESPETTHISVIDGDGNMIANTYTLNLSYGSGVVVPGTGVLLNNEMDDFSAAPGAPNAYGLVGDEKNAIAPMKRPLSSMSPVFLFKDGQPFMAVGGAGGSRIITSVLQTIINVTDRGMSLGDAVDHPRIHHQWLPDQILAEPGVSKDTQDLLKAKGHKIEPVDWFARPQAVLHKNGWTYGYADTRMPGGGACSPDGGC